MDHIISGQVANTLNNFYCHMYTHVNEKYKDMISLSVYMNWKNVQLKRLGYKELFFRLSIHHSEYGDITEFNIDLMKDVQIHLCTINRNNNIFCNDYSDSELAKILLNAYIDECSAFNLSILDQMLICSIACQLEAAMHKINKEFTTEINKFNLLTKLR